ncbi:hypothetical protein D9M73_272190 [compost metagenome]
MPGLGVGLGIEHDESGFAGVGDVVLAAANSPATVLRLRPAAHVGRVGARCRFGQGERAEQLAAGGARQPFLLLRFGAADQNRVGRQEVRGQG